MALTKDDLKEIKKIVDGSIDKAIEKSEVKMSDKIEFLIEKSELRLESKIETTVNKAKDEILEILGTEISDMANNFHEEVKTLDNHEHRIIHIERKLGIKT